MYPPFAAELKVTLGLSRTCRIMCAYCTVDLAVSLASVSNALFQQSFRAYYNKIGCQQPYYTEIHTSAARKGIDRNATLDSNQQLCELTGTPGDSLLAWSHASSQTRSVIGLLTMTT
jgi:hypothetical protein